MDISAPEFYALIGITLVIGALIGVLFWRWRSDQGPLLATLEERLQAREQRLAEAAEINRQLQQQLGESSETVSTYREKVSHLETTLEQERRQHNEKITLLNSAREQMTLEFKQLASDILEDKSQRFTATNRDSIREILKPLNEKIVQFEKKVEETYDRESKARFSLENEIRKLHEANVRISSEADNLTRALKGESRTQGTWGEVILESILEKSGLVKGREYETQSSLKGEGGSRLQPDVVIHLPDDKHVVIDAKVSLKAYEQYSSSEDESQRAQYLRQHIQSIRQHVKGLSDKEYHNLLDLKSLDFVLLFMPVEAAFTAAVQNDDSLFGEAFEKNIMLVGPSTLLATLRTIQNIWRHENQNRNALEIAQRAGWLYDKFVAFVQDLEDIGSKIDATQASYDRAHNKLTSGRGNLINRVETLKKLGARASKQHQERLLAKARDDDDIQADPDTQDPDEEETGSDGS